MTRNEKTGKCLIPERSIVILASAALLCLLFGELAFAQSFVYRIDPTPVLTTSGNVPAGGFPAAYVVPGATIKLCTDSACNNRATAYTDATGNTQCTPTAPVTLPGTSTCSSTAGSQGQFGFWVQPGTYYYTVTTTTGTFGPYPISSPTVGTLGGPGLVSANNAGGLSPMTAALDCSLATGASASIKIHACAGALPSSGGTADSRNIQGSQTWNTDAFSGISAPVDFTCAAATYTVSTNSTIPSNVHLIVGQGCIFSVSMGVTLTINGTITAPYSQIFSGSGSVLIFPGVTDVFPQWFAGSDIGAQLNNAYASLSTHGGRLRIPANSSCRTFSTTINFTTNNRAVYLEGDPGDAVCLQYTGSGTAQNWDWGITQRVSGGMRNIRLLGPDRLGSTVGISTGISAGNAAEMWLLENSKVEGFGTGVLTPNSNSFLGTIRDSAIIDNGIQYKSTANVENTGFERVTFGSTNSTSVDGVLITGNGDYHFTDCSFDNAQLHVTGASAIVSIKGGHFENIASVGTMTTYNFISWASNNTLGIFGTNILQDEIMGTWPSYITATGAGTITLHGTQDFTAITVTSLVAAANTVNVGIFGHTISGGNIANAITGATTGAKMLLPDPVNPGVLTPAALKVIGKTTFANSPNFYADLTTGNPTFAFDAGDYLQYDPGANQWQWFIGMAQKMRLSGSDTEIDSLKSTGFAGGKKVVCVDTATGILYASSSDLQCSN